MFLIGFVLFNRIISGIIEGQLQCFDKLSLFDRFRPAENGFDINFENSFSFSCYKPSKFWNGSSEDCSEKGRENMRSGTTESTRVAVTSLEININSRPQRKILYISCKIHVRLDENDCTLRPRPKGSIFW